MNRARVGTVVVAVLIGIAAAFLGNWWTAAAMVLLVASQAEGEWRDRRRSSKVAPSSVPV